MEDDIDVSNVRENEGEAAEYGIYFDDTEYDYMQHLRMIGERPDAVLLEAPGKKDKGKSKEVVFGEKVTFTLCVVDNSLGFQRRCLLRRRRVGIELKQCRIYLTVYEDFSQTWILIYEKY